MITETFRRFVGVILALIPLLIWPAIALVGIYLAFSLAQQKLPNAPSPLANPGEGADTETPQDMQRQSEQLADKSLVLLTVQTYLSGKKPADAAKIDAATIWKEAIKPLIDAGRVPQGVAKQVLDNLTDKDGWIAGIAKYGGELAKDYRQHVDKLEEQRALFGHDMDMQEARHRQSMAEERARHDQRMAEQRAAHHYKMEELRLTQGKGGADGEGPKGAPSNYAPVKVTCSPTFAVNGIAQRPQPKPKNPPRKRPKIVPGAGCKCPPAPVPKPAPAPAPALPKA